jgi:exodeoxyribonuclease VII small subunit
MTARDETPRQGDPAPPFEESLERLEHIVEELEAGALTLEDSIARYEEGVQLSRRLTLELDQAEKRIERLVGGDDQSPPTTAPMELETGEVERARERSGAPERRVAPNRAAAPARREASAGRPDPDELPF